MPLIYGPGGNPGPSLRGCILRPDGTLPLVPTGGDGKVNVREVSTRLALKSVTRETSATTKRVDLTECPAIGSAWFIETPDGMLLWKHGGPDHVGALLVPNHVQPSKLKRYSFAEWRAAAGKFDGVRGFRRIAGNFRFLVVPVGARPRPGVDLYVADGEGGDEFPPKLWKRGESASPGADEVTS
ncbi:MAG TPA: hypothetical protein VGR62_16855 [Candidatus Binatia bacterium]|nr:hypothetical protein [Candidatus Binatia bacterium]